MGFLIKLYHHDGKVIRSERKYRRRLQPMPQFCQYLVVQVRRRSDQVAGGIQRGGLAVGIGQVKVAAYLFGTSLAVRQSATEIEYRPSLLWAERLDSGFQRVLAANLSVLLPTDRIRLSAWNREDVSAEVRVVIEQFDVDLRGQGTLVARWRVTSPPNTASSESGASCAMTI